MAFSVKDIVSLFSIEQCSFFLFNRNQDMVSGIEDYPSEGIKQPVDDVLYIADFSKMDQALNTDRIQNLLCFNAASLSRPENLPPHVNLILTKEPLNADSLVKKYDTKPKKKTFAEQMLNLLANRNLYSIAIAAAKYFKNPVIICNSMLDVVAMGSGVMENPAIDTLVTRKGLSEELLIELRKELNFGEDNQLKGSQTDSIRQINLTVNDFPVTAFVITEMDSLAYVFIIAQQNRLFSQADFDILDELANGLKIYKHQRENNAPQPQLMLEYMLVKLINNEITNAEQVKARLDACNIKLKNNMFMLCMAPQNNQRITSDQLRYFSSYFRNLFESGITTTFKNIIVSVYWTDKEKFSENKMASLNKLCSDFNLKAGISCKYSNIMYSSQYYRKAMDLIALGQVLYPDNIVYTWDALSFYISFLREPATLTNDYVDDAVKTLILYDHANGTEFLLTLYYYVKYIYNATKTANKIHVHRNTLVYRIKKIEEIAGIDFEDRDVLERLMRSFRALEFNASVEKRKLCFLLEEDFFDKIDF